MGRCTKTQCSSKNLFPALDLGGDARLDRLDEFSISGVDWAKNTSFHFYALLLF